MKNDQGEYFLVTDAHDISSDEYKSDSDSYSNHSGQYSLLENIENIDIDSNEIGNISSSDDDIEISSNHNGSIIVDNCEMYQDFIMGHNNSTINNNGDMEISSSCNGSIIIDNCKMYQEFVTGRNSSTIGKEDISGTETTLIGTSNCDDIKYFDDVENDNVINDNTTVIQKSINTILKGSSTSSTALEVKSKQCNNVSNLNEENLEFEQPSVFSHRSLLDVNGFTEKLLSIPDKEL